MDFIKSPNVECLLNILNAINSVQCTGISNVDCFFKMLEAVNDVNCSGYCDYGSITLANGAHEIEVLTACDPTEVWIRIVSDDVPVCNGNIDLVGYQIIPGGFILYADIKSSSAEVFYAVK